MSPKSTDRKKVQHPATAPAGKRASRPAKTDSNSARREAVKTLSRIQIRRVLDSAQVDAPQEGGESRQAVVIREHPEYGDQWGRVDELSDEEIEQGDANPIAHMTFHLIVENQLADNDPPEVRQVLDALTKDGVSRHDALHRIVSIYSEELYPVLSKKREFDTAGYARRLRQLAHQ